MLKQQDLISQNYTRNEWTDKNISTDTFPTLKFIEYKKPINDHFYIEVDFAFIADEPDKWMPLETACGLVCSSGDSIPLPKDIDKLEQLYGLLK